MASPVEAVEGSFLRPFMRRLVVPKIRSSPALSFATGVVLSTLLLLHLYQAYSSASSRASLFTWSGLASGSLQFLALNLSLSVSCIAAVPPASGPADRARFSGYPRWSWLVPALQQGGLCIPAVVALSSGCGGGEYLANEALYLCQMAAAVLILVFGMNMREFVIFEGTDMMVLHHVASIALCAMLWAFVADPALAPPQSVALIGFSLASMEAGSFGVNVGVLFNAKAFQFAVMTLSHVLALLAGVYVTWQTPHAVLLVTAAVTSVFIVMRQHHSTNEFMGRSTGTFSKAD